MTLAIFQEGHKSKTDFLFCECAEVLGSYMNLRQKEPPHLFI